MMKTLFQPDAVAEILERLDKLRPDTPGKWGKMDVSQMLAHCSAAFEVGLGDRKLKRFWLGYLFGAWAKKQFVYSTTFKKNQPTDPTFLIKDQRQFDMEKQRLKEMINRFYSGGEAGVTSSPHSFFGKMTPQEWALLSYNHLNHHLSQFGV